VSRIVSDTVNGIVPADQEKVFEEFRRVGDGGEEGRRHGLGLTLCRKFVELAAWRDGSISI